jgi:glycosyltransferase involved in cell wall biosynthesis
MAAMRIAFITPGFSAHANDWAIPALLNLARTLAQNHEIHVFSQRYPAQGLYQFDGLTHHAVGGGQKFGLTSARIWWQTTQAIIRQHRQTPFDVLHAFWADEAGFSAALAGFRLKRPIVVSLGGGELTNLPDLNYGAQRFLVRRLTTRYALKKATLVTAGSNYQLSLCRAHHVPEPKLRLAPLGVDTTLFQPINLIFPLQAKSTPDRAVQNPILVQAASLLPVKNQHLLFEVLSLVNQEIPDIKLRLAGAGPLQNELIDLAQSLDLNQSIVWQQQLDYPSMAQLYQTSHLYLQTSRHESQGMAVLEAMACGLPVLSTPVGVARDVACLPPQISAEALAAQVIEILSDKARYQKLCQQAHQTIEATYSLPITTGNFLKIYDEALNNR